MSTRLVFFSIDPEDVSFSLIKQGFEPCEDFCKHLFTKLNKPSIYQMASKETNQHLQETLIQQEIWRQIQFFPEVIALQVNITPTKHKIFKP